MARGQYDLPGKSTLAEPEPERGRNHYRKMREPFAAELKDPATRRLLKGIISAENPGAGPAVVESLMNRTAMVNEQRATQGKPPLKLRDMIVGHGDVGGKSFYGPVRSGAINQHLARVDSDPNYSAQLDKNIERALGGSDTIRGHTDQGSRGDPNYITGGVGVNINGERFNDWGYPGSAAWREKQQAAAAADEPQPYPASASIGAAVGGGAPQQVSTTTEPPIPTASTSTEVATGDEAPTLAESKNKTDEDTKKKSYGSILGDMFADFGKSMAEGPIAKGATKGSTPANAALPTMPTPSGPVSMIANQQSEAQRQQLAMILQRLNAGRLG